jgi:hypothetical protein
MGAGNKIRNLDVFFGCFSEGVPPSEGSDLGTPPATYGSQRLDAASQQRTWALGLT